MSDSERQQLALLVGEAIGKIDAVSDKVDEVRVYSYNIKSSIDGRIMDANRRIDDEKSSRILLERSVIDTRQRFIDAFEQHSKDDREAFKSINEKLDAINSARAESRRTWGNRAWSAAKFIGLILGAWLAGHLGVPLPTV